METRQIHVRDLSTVTGIQQFEHEVQSIYFLGLEDFVGTIYLSIESDDYSNEAIPLTSNTFIIGQPMTLYNTTYTCQIYGVLNDGEKIQLSKRFRLIVDKSNDIQGESSEYPIDPNFENSIVEFVNEQKAEIDEYVEQVIESIPSDYSELEARVDELENSQGGGLTEEAKQALLACFAKVAWIDGNGQSYYNALENALYPPIVVTNITLNTNSLSFATLNSTQQLTATTTPTGGAVTWSSSNTSIATVSATGLVTSVGYGTAIITASCQGYTATCAVTIVQATLTSISAVYTQSGTVYSDDSLDTLKSDLVVTASWSNGTTSTVASEDYTLSGTLEEGTSTITVSYGGKSATFEVTVTEKPSFNVTYTQGNLSVNNTDANRVTGVIGKAIHFKQGDTFTINVPQGYSVYPFGFSASNVESNAGTRYLSNVLYAYCVSDSGYVAPRNADISGDLQANGSSMKGNGAFGFQTSDIVYTYVPVNASGYSFKGLGFLVKKNDNSSILPSDIEAIMSFDYVEA